MDSKYTFRCVYEHEDGREESTITHKIDGTDMSWDELIERFIEFLRGCGYILPDGEIEFVDYSKDVHE